jgi:hypothetical protein
MKKILVIAFVFLMSLKILAKDGRHVFPTTCNALSLSSSSIYSYEDAMNKFSKTKPNNYVIESINYFKSNGRYFVQVRLRKI